MLEELLYKKIYVWIVGLLVLLLIVAAIIFGWVVKRTVEHGTSSDNTSATALQIASIPDFIESYAEDGVSGVLDKITFKSVSFDEFNGLSVVDEDWTEEGYLLVSSYSGEEEISTVYLFDLKERKKIYEWIPPYDEIITNAPDFGDSDESKAKFMNTRKGFRAQHPLLLSDGSVVYSSGEGPLARQMKDGGLGWVINRHFHHSIEWTPDSNLVVPVVIPDDRFEFRNDGYAIVDVQTGEILEETSIADIFLKNGYEVLLYGFGNVSEDRVHLNDAEYIFETDEYVKRGDIMLSVRAPSTVFLYRPSTQKIVWLKTGPWLQQHDIDYIGDGKFMIFGNNHANYGKGWEHHDHSDIYVYTPETGEISRPYNKIFSKYKLRTPTQGWQQLLDNGDVVLSLTDSYMLFRISSDRIRWKYVHNTAPGRIGALHWCRYIPREKLQFQPNMN